MDIDISTNHEKHGSIELKASPLDWGILGPSTLATAIANLRIDAETQKQLDEIYSETAPRERYFLYNFFKKLWRGKGCVVEVGAFLGGTTRAICLGMHSNPKALSPRFVTIDQFENYHRPHKLEEKASTLLTKYADDEGTISDIRKGNWLRLFEAIHKRDKYGSFIEILKGVLPDKKEEIMSDEVCVFFKDVDYISVLFVDGCKSWYSTKTLMKAVVPKLNNESYLIFQDYGRHTCFWISSFLEAFKENFKLIASISGTFTFKYVKELGQGEIERRFPDEPTVWSKDDFCCLYQTLLDKAYVRSDTGAIFSNTLHMAAAFAYLGYKDDARKLVKSCLAFPGFNLCKHLSLSALKTPTFTPDKPIYLDD